LPFFTLPLVYGSEITTCRYKGLLRSMSCFATDFPSKASLVVLRIPHQRPLLHQVVQANHKVCHINDIKNDAHLHSIKQNTQPIPFLISKEVIPYRTNSGTCCPGVSTLKIRSIADSSTTWHDDINHLHHSDLLEDPSMPVQP
jgi:hypothetical protein